MPLKDLDWLVAADTETTGLSTWQGARPFAVSLCDSKGVKAYFRALKVDPSTRRVTWGRATLAVLRSFFGDTRRTFVFHNSKFDVRMLESVGVEVKGRIEDTMFAAHALDNLSPLGLKQLSARLLDIPDDDQKELLRATTAARRKLKGKALLAEAPEADYWLAPPELCKRYALLDSERAMLLWLLFEDQMKEEGVYSTYLSEMRNLWPVTYAMESRGVRVHLDVVEREIQRHEAELKAVESELRRKYPKLNIRSPKQLAQELYEKAGLKPEKFTDSGLPSTKFLALRNLNHPLPNLVNRQRGSEKALKSFFYPYRDLSLPEGGARILHPDFQQVGPATARFSCRHPNLQNVADANTARSATAFQAREPFGPRDGWVWYHYDYSQLEVRIFADVAQEDFMLSALAHARDMHTECANRAWGGDENPAAIRMALQSLELVSWTVARTEQAAEAVKKLREKFGKAAPDELLAKEWLRSFGFDVVAAEKSLGKKKLRTHAKMLLFLKVFGGGVSAAANLMECSKAEAQEFLADYDRAFPKIARYIDEMSGLARRQGFIHNRYGRRLLIPSDKPYKAVNYMVQSSAADLMKERMAAVGAYLKEQRESGRAEGHVVLTIHDELVVEVRKEQAFPWFLRRIRTLMEDHGKRFGIPMPVECAKTVKNWNRKEAVPL